MIKISKLSFMYPGSSQLILDNISLDIKEGDFVAIIGNNGCGKSTLCKTLNGLIPNFIVGDLEGSIEIDGKSVSELEIGDLAQKVGYVYQDFENQIVCPKVLDDASFACLNYAHEDYIERGKDALHMCGLLDKENDYIWQLSGGQKHLLALAGVTALNPNVLILDEPIAQLDPRHAKQIYEVLKNLNEKHGKTIIVIEHHTEFIASYCKTVVLLKDGKVSWKLDTKSALQRVDELEECNIFPPQITQASHLMKKKQLVNPQAELPINLEEGKAFFSHMNWTTERELDIEVKSYQDSIIEFKNISVEYRSIKGNPVEVIKDLNLTIRKGEKIALIGSNGAGKSTIMKLMIGLIKLSDGEVFIDKKSLDNISKEELSNFISLVYQNPEAMFIKDSIRNDVMYAMKSRGVLDYKERTNELLEMFRLTQMADRDGRLLSGGQMRRASLAVGIALKPKILLLDEPTANLDIATRKEIMKTLIAMKDVTETVIIATHDMQLVCDWADRIIVLSEGKAIADGNRNEIFSSEYLKEKVGIRAPEIVELGQLLNMKDLCFTINEFVSKFIPLDENQEGWRCSNE